SLPSSDGTASVLDERESPEAIVAEPDNPDDDRPVPELTLTEIEEELETHYWGTLSVVGALLIVLCVVGAIALTRFQQSSNAIWTWLITLLVVVVAYSIVRRGMFPLWESAPGFAVR